MRKDISNNNKKKLKELLLKEDEKIKEIDKGKLSKIFYKGVMTEFKIHNWVIKFRERKRERDLIKKKQMKKKKDDNILKINENEMLVKF